MSKTIADKTDQSITNTTLLNGGAGPSARIEDEPTFARVCALIGAFCTVVGGVALYMGVFTTKTLPFPFTVGWASLILHFGVLCLLFHAAYDANIEFRRVYQCLGVLCLVVGVILSLVPYGTGNRPGQVGDLLGPGFLFLTVALLLLLFTLRNETVEIVRNYLELTLLAAGAVLAVMGLFGGSLSIQFFTPVGLVLALAGLVYLVAFVGLRGTSDDFAYRAGLVVGAVGLIVFFTALWRSSPGFGPLEILILIALAVEIGTRLLVNSGRLAPDARLFSLPLATLRTVTWLAFLVLFVIGLWVVYGSGWVRGPNDRVWAEYLIPHGVLMMGLGLIYFCSAYLICSDQTWVVMTRRELASFFYSPIAYFALFVSSIFATVSFFLFSLALLSSDQFGGMTEPIVKNLFVSNLPAVIVTICVVPALTMRLLSEEKRSGTLEVLLTSPIDDFAVVFSKFVSALLTFLVIWAPFAVYLLSLRIAAGKDFDYRPLLSFLIALIITGANFVGMGLFFSSLSRSQIVGFLLAFVGMLVLTFLVVFEYYSRADKNAFWEPVLHHLSYYDAWNSAIEGKLQPKLLIFPATMTVMWLFLTVKVLEVRKWS
jgi:ABC-2 type transport system permease protein